MAYISNTAFEARVTNHEFDSTANITGVFDNSGAEICSAGFLCKQDELLPNEGYTGINNSNSWKMIAATATDLIGTPIYACNPFDVNQITDNATGAIYKVGSNTLGLAAPAGMPVTFTRINFDGASIYRFGVGNLSTTLSTNTFATIANGLLSPTASAPTAAFTPYFKVVGTGTFTQGAYPGFGYVDVIACFVASNASE